MTEQAAPEPAEPSEAESTEAAAPQSTKEKFEAALAKKKADGQTRSSHLDGHGGVGGATASHKATRQFRRKSG